MIAPLIAEEVANVGGRDVAILLQDYSQLVLVPLPGHRLSVGDPQPVNGSDAGTAFLRTAAIEPIAYRAYTGDGLWLVRGRRDDVSCAGSPVPRDSPRTRPPPARPRPGRARRDRAAT